MVILPRTPSVSPSWGGNGRREMQGGGAVRASLNVQQQAGTIRNKEGSLTTGDTLRPVIDAEAEATGCAEYSTRRASERGEQNSKRRPFLPNNSIKMTQFSM